MLSLASRRSALFGRPNDAAKIRPPGAVAEFDFDSACDRCGGCAAQCAEDIIVFDSRGLPELDFSKGGCTFCGECTSACETAALSAQGAWPWTIKLSQKCLSLSGVQCRVCQDTCDQSAILFKLQVGGAATPVIRTEACNGCGFCIAPCPSNALSLFPSASTKEVHK